MEFRELNTFLHVARRQSFSRAAEELGYSQAAVTIQIKNLEQELNTHLFDRIGKQTTLTHQGQQFYSYASNIMKELAQAKEAVSCSDTLTGRLCIGTIESICSSILPPLLCRYHEQYPQVRLQVVNDSPETLLDLMDKNQIDIVYFLDRPVYSQKWVKVLEEPEDVIFVTSPSHPYARQSSLLLQDVIRQPFIATEKDASYRFLLEQHLISHQLPFTPYLETGNTNLIIRQLLQKGDISFLPAFLVEEYLKQQRLCALDVLDYRLKVWRQIVYHRDKWVTREMQAFLELAV